MMRPTARYRLRLALTMPYDFRYWHLGSGIATIRLAEGLAARGHDVQVFAGHSANTNVCEHKGVVIHAFTSPALPALGTTIGERKLAIGVAKENARQPFDAILSRSGYQIHLMRHIEGPRFVYFLDDIERREYSALPSLSSKIRTLPQAGFISLFESISVSTSDSVVVLTPAGRDDVISEYQFTRHKIVVIPSPVDDSWLQGSGPAWGKRVSDPEFLFIGAGRRRSLSLFMSALAVLNSRGLKASGLVIRASESDASRLARAYSVSCHAWAAVPTSELIALTDRAVALVVPSRREGLCLPIIEAAARGTPAIISESAQMADLARGLGSALQVSGFDAGDWANTMLSLATDATAWTKLSNSGKERAREYSTFRIVETLEESLMRVVAGDEYRLK